MVGFCLFPHIWGAVWNLWKLQNHSTMHTFKVVFLIPKLANVFNCPSRHGIVFATPVFQAPWPSLSSKRSKVQRVRPIVSSQALWNYSTLGIRAQGSGHPPEELSQEVKFILAFFPSMTTSHEHLQHVISDYPCDGPTERWNICAPEFPHRRRATYTFYFTSRPLSAIKASIYSCCLCCAR